MESISSSNSKSDRIYEFVDSIKKSISSGSTKVSDMVTSNKPTPDNPSPLLLTEDLRSMSLSPNTKSSSILNSQSPTTDKTSFSIFGSNAGTGSAGTGSASAGPANVSSSTSKSSWLNVGKTSRIGIKVILVVLLLGFIGINIFVYLGFSVKTMYELLDKFIKSIKSLLSGNKSKSKPKPKPPQPKPPQGKSSQGKSSQGKSSQGKSSQDKPKTIKDLVDDIEEPTEDLEKKTEIKPDEDRTSIHTSGKSGYCNVGSWKGIRSCVKVSKASECISGDIFPTKDICINPNLRH